MRKAFRPATIRTPSEPKPSQSPSGDKETERRGDGETERRRDGETTGRRGFILSVSLSLRFSVSLLLCLSVSLSLRLSSPLSQSPLPILGPGDKLRPSPPATATKPARRR